MPNQLTNDEKTTILHSSHLAFINGDIEQSIKIAKQLPLSPRLATLAKELLGVEELKKSGFNLSEMETLHGSQWIDS